MSEHTDRVLEDMSKSPGFAEHVERTLGWHLEHKRLGFADPIADLYEELLNEKEQLSEENATLEQKAQQTDYISRQAAIDAIEENILAREDWLTDSRGERKGLDVALCLIQDLPYADVPDTNVGDMISRQAAIDAVQKTWISGTSLCKADEATDIINNLPSEDVVEVVRCKDCKNWEVGEDNGFYCFEICVLSGLNTTRDDYCSYGERRTDG